MSLTWHLKEPESMIYQFMKNTFPKTQLITHDVRAAMKTRVISKAIRAKDAPYRYDIVGMALDYRIRYAFALTPARSLVAYQGFRNLAARFPNKIGVRETFFAELDAYVGRVKPVSRLMASEYEWILARYCYILALLECVFRSGEVDPILLPKKAYADIFELIAQPPNNETHDLMRLIQIFFENALPYWPKKMINLNPSFEGSLDVGGADADMILDGCLYEIKCIAELNKAAQYIRQLAGYVLLDYSDKLQIQAVGFYLARYGCFVSWPIEEFFRRLTGMQDFSLVECRNRFQLLLQTEDI